MRKHLVVFVDVEHHQPADGRDAIERVEGEHTAQLHMKNYAGIVKAISRTDARWAHTVMERRDFHVFVAPTIRPCILDRHV